VSDTAPEWEPATFQLGYRLGEIPLGHKQFRALSLRTHYFDLTDDIAEPPPPIGRLERDFDVLVTRSHPYREPLARLSRRDGVLRYVRSRYTRYHTDLTGRFEDYLAGFSAKSRSTLRRKVRRFTEQGARCGMRVFRQPDEMEEFLLLARQVSALTYQEKLLDAGIPGDPAYLDELVALATRDSVRAYLLELSGAPVAYLCCPATRGILLYGYLGYDPRHADLSPGTVLQYLAFESLFAERKFRAFDFTEGQGEHKRFFGTVATPCADICYFRAGPASWFWVGLHIGLDRLSTAAVRMLDRLGLKSRVKNFLRRR
jgi:CelD/BcsL family acetyltransferase involved in cellulose biosynthesis